MIAGQLEIQLLADVARIKKDMETATKTVTGAMQSIDKAVGFANKALGILGAGLSIQKITNYADAWTSASNQLRIVAKDTESLSKTQQSLLSIANDTRSSFQSTANLYARLSRATEGMSLSQKELLDITETINQSFAVSGATAAEASAAITQLSQGLAAGALRGDEFNSVAEQAPSIMRAIADSLGMTIGELRKFASTGGITAQIVVDALKGAAGSIDGDFDKAMVTLGQSFQVANNNMMEFFGTSKTIQLGMSTAGKAIVTVSENIDTLAKVAELAALAMTARLAPGMAVAAFQMVTTTGAATALRGALMLLGGPAGATIMAVGSLALLVSGMETASERATRLKGEIDSLSEAEINHAKAIAQSEILAAQVSLDRLARVRSRSAADERAYQLQAARIEEINNRLNQYDSAAKKAAEASSKVAESAKAGATAVESFTRAHVGALESVSMNTDAMRELLLMQDETLNGWKQAPKPIKDTEKSLRDLTLVNKSVVSTMADDWEDATQRIARSLADLVVYGSGSLKHLGNSALSGALTGGFTSLLGGGGGLTSSIVNGASSAMGIGNLIGGSGLLSKMGFLTSGQAAALNLPASAGGLGSLMGGLGTIAPWIAGAAALAAVFDKKSTPSWNSGFLLQDVPGAKPDQTFSTAAFASGLNPVGFTRRTSQAEAEQTIELFRQLDKLIVDTAALGGYKVNPSALMGYSETGLGSGVFFGGAGEKGKPGTALEQQMQAFATQLIGSLRGQLDDAVLNDILSGGSVDAMLAKLKETLNLQNETISAQETLAKQQAEALAAQEAALDRFQAALGATREYIDGIAQAQRDALTEQRRAIEDSYREQMRAEEDLHNRRVALFRSLQDAINGFRLGDLTTLNPRDQLSLAQANFRSLATAANNTNLSMADRVAAAEQLQGASQSYLQAGRSFYASSGGYKDIFSEVLGTLEGARFLGTNQAFNATPYENAMLDEMKKLNESVLKLPDGFASRMQSLMFNLVAQGRMAGLNDTQISNAIRNYGPDAVAAADKTGLLMGGVAGNATPDPTIVEQIRFTLQNHSEEAAVRALAQMAKDQQIGSGYLAEVVAQNFGVPSSRVGDLLAKYNIPMFEEGTSYIPRDMLAYVHKGEAVLTASDNASIAAEIRALRGEVSSLTAEVVTLRQWQQTADQAKVNKLADIAESNKGMANKMEMASNAKVGSAAA